MAFFFLLEIHTSFGSRWLVGLAAFFCQAFGLANGTKKACLLTSAHKKVIGTRGRTSNGWSLKKNPLALMFPICEMNLVVRREREMPHRDVRTDINLRRRQPGGGNGGEQGRVGGTGRQDDVGPAVEEQDSVGSASPRPT